MVTIDVQTLQAGLRRLLAPGQPLPMEFAFTYIKAFYLGAKHPSPNPNPSPNLHPNRNPNVHQGLLPRRRRYPRVVARAPRVQRAPDLRPRRADGRQHAGQEEAAHRPRDAIVLRNCGTAGVCGVRGGRLRMTCTRLSLGLGGVTVPYNNFERRASHSRLVFPFFYFFRFRTISLEVCWFII